MNARQIEIGDAILRLLAKDGQANADIYYSYLTEECGFDSINDQIQIGMVRTHLHQHQLIQHLGNSDYWFSLTQEGIKASKVGLNAWLNKPMGVETTDTYRPKDPFTEPELELMMKKIDELGEKLIAGQQVTYDDISAQLDELKSLLAVLGKQTWRQVLNGKLIDAGLGQIADQVGDLIIEIFKDQKLLR